MHRLYHRFFVMRGSIRREATREGRGGEGREGEKKREKKGKKKEKIVGRNIPPAGFSKLLFTVRRNGVHGGKNNSGRPG